MRKRLSTQLKIMTSCLFLMLCAQNAFASISSDLNSYFDGLGFESNATEPTAYEGQNAGYYTGGGLYARNTVRNVQLMHVDLPSYRAGCGGIDIWSGGFSFINSDQLTSFFENIMNNAVGYAFNLAMETETPEIANAYKWLFDVSNRINQANLNSCETASSLVGSVWPKTAASQRAVCESIGTSGSFGIFDDWAAARQGCGNGGEMSSVLSQGKKDSAYAAMIVEGNMAWKAIKANSFLSGDDELSELFMSLSGTVIITSKGSGDDAKHKQTILPSLADKNDLIKALLHGGEATIYVCDDTSTDGCLNPSLKTVNISSGDALASQVKDLLEDMVEKLGTDETLTDQEKGLLQSTTIPVYKILKVEKALQHDAATLNSTQYADLVATDILAQYLSESLDTVKNSMSVLNYPTEVLAPFEASLEKAFSDTKELEKQANNNVITSNQLIEYTQGLERMLVGQFSSGFEDSIEWAKGVGL